MSKESNLVTTERDARVLQLYEDLLEIEQRLIPTGLHIFGRPSQTAEKIDLLKMVAAFDRPEFGAKALPDLVANGLGYSGTKERTLEQREHIDSVVREAVTHL